ncbi:alpha-(1,3)-fucosyltransferase 4-like [Synchiropus splendidus]|uniref:alpha-(1,3)-fucosyltransferase 4-like n=1 Tax=Synchiropus splendidus TaxID=270530 RepID=UPI00237E28AC|nr:alpha-(1,3)-fucosyltransferase 4-like [Synchiropus splendidus]
MGVSRAVGLSAPANSRSFLLGKCSFLRLFIVGFLLLVALVPLYLPVPEPFPSVAAKKKPEVTLLIWTHPFGKRQKLPDCLTRFRIGGCALTDDEGAYPRADAVILHHREIGTGAIDVPPEPRPREQKWIWLNYESPSHTPELSRWDGVFNMTMSYRTDSDIYLPYGYLLQVPGDGLGAAPPSHLRKPRLLAWVVSNWSESQARVAFYDELSRFVSVDVFGRAGRTIPGDNGSSSVVALLTRYQFYLSLENSLHTDYITEKLWNAVRAGAIPVVLGPSRRNYERFLPAEAFIHVDDFPTVRELARYLLTVRRNPALLLQHLSWRGRYRVHQPSFWAEHYCVACRAVKRARGRTSVVRDLSRWFNS